MCNAVIKMQELINQIEEELSALKRQLEFADKIARSESGEREIKYLVFSHEILRLRIDANMNHSRAHIHLDYGHEIHAASIAIDTGELLAGRIPHKYSRRVIDWITKNRETLNEIWKALRESRNPDQYKLTLSV